MKTILIPVDFSESSIQSCRYAFDFLGQEEGVIHLFHIYYDQVLLPDTNFSGGMESDMMFNNDLMMTMREQAEKEMDALIANLKNIINEKGCNIELKFTLLGGDPRWEITETIEALHPTIVIMGTQGKGEKGFLEGRMAGKIMKKSTVPVLAVPGNFPLFSMANVLYTTSFNPLDVEAIKQLFNILGTHQVPIQVCHFMREKEKDEASQRMQELQNHAMQEVKSKNISFHLIMTENESTALKNFTKYQKIDLVSFLPGKKHLLRNLFLGHKLRKKDFFNLELPLLAIHI